MLSISVLSMVFFSFQTSAQSLYCVGSNLGGGGCGASNLINSVVIAGTSFNSTGPVCNTGANGSLTVFPDTGSATASLTQGQTYSLSVTPDGNQIISVWIDYDHNLVFDASEHTQVCLTSVAGTAYTVSIAVPFGAFSGQTGMLVRSRASGSPNGAGDACSQFFSGEAEEYLITIVAGSPCVAPPTAGTTFSPSTSVCLATAFTVSLNGNSIGSGQTYQWQSSTNGTTWIDIIGATNNAYTDTMTGPTYYQCMVTCAGQTTISTPLLISQNAPNQCYCTSVSNSTADDDIGNVTISNLNNGVGTPALNNPASTAVYTDFTSLPPVDLIQGVLYPISITQINSAGFYSCFATVHIDFDQNGIFDSTEVFPIGQTQTGAGNNVLNGNITAPLTSLTGTTRMRIVLREGGSAIQSPCGNYGYGETEDYLVNIISATPCIAPPTAGTANANATSVCDSSMVMLSLSGNSIGIGQTYQWQSSTDNVTWTPINGATSQVATVQILSSISFRCEVTCSGIPVNSAAVDIILKPSIQCYCTSAANSTVDDDLGWFEFGPILIAGDTTARNNPTSVNTYTDYTIFGTFPFNQGNTYPLKAIQINSSANFYVCILTVYLDYDQNGIYDPATETIFTDTTNNTAGGNLMTGTVTIPANAPIGNTGMRAVLKENLTGNSPCGNYGYGETEDYLVYIDYPTAVKTIGQNASLTAMPNPTSDRLMLSFISNENENVQLKLVNLSGQVVFSDNLNHFAGKYSKTLDVSAFAKGIYNLQLVTSTSVTNKKVVIK